jgi:hypothetical protein
MATAQSGDLRRFIDTALQVARDRAQLLDEVRAALETGDDRTAIVLMRRYVGLPAVKVTP